MCYLLTTWYGTFPLDDKLQLGGTVVSDAVGAVVEVHVEAVVVDLDSKRALVAWGEGVNITLTLYQPMLHISVSM